MKIKILYIFALLILLASSLSFASEDQEKYDQALNAIKAGNHDFAFMHFLSIVRQNSKSGHREEALFAVAEYYFQASNYHDAFNALTALVDEYPNSKMKPFALCYLLKIARSWGKHSLAKELEQEIINLKQVVLLFKDVKEFKYKSPFGRKYRLAYYIDRVEFYVNGELSAQISY